MAQYVLTDGNDVHNLLTAEWQKVYGVGGNDTIYGSTGTDSLYGNHGDDVLVTRGGSDKLFGGDGDDIFQYRWNNGSIQTQVVELADGGTDTLVIYGKAGQSYALAANVENLLVNLSGQDGSGGFGLYGNELANSIAGGNFADTIGGGAGNDTIDGGGSADRIYGDAGNDLLLGGGNVDTLYGGAGSDTLDGGLANDLMFGGTGNDTYYVTSTGDVASELANEGIDVVRTTLSTYQLGPSMEALVYVGAGTFAGTGNSLNNKIDGGGANDTLSGLGGNDTLWGLAGNDSLLGGDGNDSLDGGNGHDVLHGEGGHDKIEAGAGNDLATGGAGNDTVNGGSGNDVLRGGVGSDKLDGGAGNDWLFGDEGQDTLTGGAGNDRFVFGAAADSHKNFPDAILGFEKGADRIDLSLIDGDGAAGAANAFHFTGTEPFFKTAGDLWVVEGVTGSYVRGDLQGDGAYDFQIHVAGVFGLTASDFIL